MNVYFINIDEIDATDIYEVVSNECDITYDEAFDMVACDAVALLSDDVFIKYATDVMTLKEYTDLYNQCGAPDQERNYIRFV